MQPFALRFVGSAYDELMPFESFIRMLNEGIILTILVGVELGIRYARYTRRQRFELGKKEVANARELEALTLEYNRKDQILGFGRLAAIFVALLLSILLYDIQAFSYFIIGIGSLVFILRESVSSLVAYFYILAVFDVGADIKIGESLGEISRIAPLYTSIIGKEESGEYNGKLSLVPNYLFLQQKTERQELKTTNFRRASILWTYDRQFAKVSFGEAVQKTRLFLDELLPVRSAGEIGYYRSYAGRRYRLGLDFSADGKPTMHIAFVTHPTDTGALREKIITMLEEIYSSSVN